jgi:hypothetical protein
LQDTCFYISPGCTPYVQVIEDIILCAGGQVEKKRRAVAYIQEQNKAKPNSYILLADTNDLHLLVDAINANLGMTPSNFERFPIIQKILFRHLLIRDGLLKHF